MAPAQGWHAQIEKCNQFFLLELSFSVRGDQQKNGAGSTEKGAGCTACRGVGEPRNQLQSHAVLIQAILKKAVPQVSKHTFSETRHPNVDWRSWRLRFWLIVMHLHNRICCICLMGHWAWATSSGLQALLSVSLQSFNTALPAVLFSLFFSFVEQRVWGISILAAQASLSAARVRVGG